MNYPIHIRFTGMDSSAVLAAAAEAYAYGLPWAESEIIECWVGIHFDPEERGLGGQYSARVDVKIPGHDLVAPRMQHDDALLAIRDAFQDIEAQLRAVDPRIHRAEFAPTVNGQLMRQDDPDKGT